MKRKKDEMLAKARVLTEEEHKKVVDAGGFTRYRDGKTRISPY